MEKEKFIAREVIRMGDVEKRQYALGEIPQAHKLNNDNVKESISKYHTKIKDVH